MDEDDTTAAEVDEEVEPAASDAPPVDEPVEVAAPEGALRVPVVIDDEGNGTSMVGLDIDRCVLWNAPGDCSVGLTAAHTIGISRVHVSGAKPGSTVHVVVVPK